ncbi:rust resistance kinase Lr10-like [Papaver somniferum]|uniref:rust resistance kinase Lr10-like n=1 Tax=Papaver somniferum TaxID=3469 RepID=UPI000E700F16|nr:rust resistance kinase Lr10-like [Papaver somniferum]
MSRTREKAFVYSIIHSIIILQHIIRTSSIATASKNACPSSSCGRLSNPQIRFPFHLKGQQSNQCGYPGFELSCTNKNKAEIELPVSGKFLVKDINYASQSMEIYDQNGCIPRRLMLSGFDLSGTPFKTQLQGNYTFFNCSKDNTDGPDRRTFAYDFRSISCLSSGSYKTFYLDPNESIAGFSREGNCRISAVSIRLPSFDSSEENSLFMHWDEPKCSRCEIDGGKCRYENHNSSLSVGCFGPFSIPPGPPPHHKSKGKQIAIAVSLSGIFVYALSVLIIFIKVFKKADMEEKENLRIEQFLENNALKPTRYSHAEIKKITNKFETKLGQGGYGSVFEGNLTNGIRVAVKILDNSEGSNNGEEFVNEVGTIGRIHHLNVVRLLGYCVEGSMRALVYEFMLNSSLDRFIFSAGKDKTSIDLGWPKLQEIAIGIARGMEYLHQGCDKRILHFDIKPQNILLDHNFTPKISDFGLAKLCTKDTFVSVSMAAARGTMGYIAPEVFSRNFGIVSYKSDVYSFGMLLLDMVGGKKNTQILIGTRSGEDEYFPEWVYNRLNLGEDLGILAEAEGLEIVKKLAMVALWCIQWNPVDRPSMNAVLHLLGGNTENLLMAPNPFISISSSSSVNHSNETELTVILED